MATASRCRRIIRRQGRDIAANLASFRGLTIFNGDGTEPAQALQLIAMTPSLMSASSESRRCLG
jgi:hypothetical protein